MDIETIKGLGITDEALAAKIIDAHTADVAGLKTQQQKLLDEKKALADKYKDVDVEEYTQLKTKKGGAKSLEEKIANLEKMLSERDEVVKQKEKKAMQLYRDREIEKAIEANGGIARALRKELADMVQVVDSNGEYSTIVLDNAGKERTNGKGGAFTLSDLLAELKTSGEWDFAFKSSGSTGGGATNSNRGASGAQTLRRSQFDALSPAERVKFAKAGGKITD